MTKIRAAITGVQGYVPDYVLTKKIAETASKKIVEEAKKKAIDLNAKADVEAKKLIQKAADEVKI
jgi:vacuolar-type H+-ATPase subunit H